MPIHDTGLWLTEDGEVVTSAPSGGSTMIVAKGGEIGPQHKARLDRLGYSLNDEGEAVAPEEPEAPKVDGEAKKAAPAKKAAAKKSA